MRASLRLGLVGTTLAALVPATAAADGEPFQEVTRYVLTTRTDTVLLSGPLEVEADRTVLTRGDALVPVRVWIRNRGTRPEKVKLAVRGDDNRTTFERTVTTSPGTERHVWMPLTERGRLSVAAGERKETAQLDMAGHVGAILFVGEPTDLEDLLGRPSPTRGPMNPAVMLTKGDGSELPPDLAVFTGLDVVFLTRESWDQLPDGPRAAIASYVRAGGRLLVGSKDFGTTKLTKGTDLGGFGTVDFCTEDGPSCAQTLKNVLGRDARWGFGRVSAEALLPGTNPARERFGWVMLAYVAALGAGSIVVSRRRGRPALLWFVPGLALATSILIVTVAAATEGFGTHARTHALVRLEGAPEAPTAQVIAAGVFYSHTAVRPIRLPAGATFASSDIETAAVDFSDGGITLREGTLPPREFRQWGITFREPSTARLVVSQVGPGRQVENQLGAPVRRLTIRKDHMYWLATNVPSGGQAPLSQSLEPLAFSPHGPLGALFGHEVSGTFRVSLSEGEFLAELDGPGPLPLGDLDIEHHGSTHEVRGRVAP